MKLWQFRMGDSGEYSQAWSGVGGTGLEGGTVLLDMTIV